MRLGRRLPHYGAVCVSSGLSLVWKAVLSSPNGCGAQRPQTAGPLPSPRGLGLPPDRGESAVSTRASLAAGGIPDFLDVPVAPWARARLHS